MAFSILSLICLTMLEASGAFAATCRRLLLEDLDWLFGLAHIQKLASFNKGPLVW